MTIAVMLSHGRFLGTAVGALVNLVTEAARRGVRWIADKTGIHHAHRASQAPSQPSPG